jgi:hypothetical protein
MTNDQQTMKHGTYRIVVKFVLEQPLADGNGRPPKIVVVCAELGARRFSPTLDVIGNDRQLRRVPSHHLVAYLNLPIREGRNRLKGNFRHTMHPIGSLGIGHQLPWSQLISRSACLKILGYSLRVFRACLVILCHVYGVMGNLRSEKGEALFLAKNYAICNMQATFHHTPSFFLLATSQCVASLISRSPLE